MAMNQTLSSNESTSDPVGRSCFRGACRFNNSRIPQESEGISGPCGYCDIGCTYSAIQCIFTVGIIANAIVVVCVTRDKKLRNVTFVAIAACAAADTFFLIVDLVVSYRTVISTMICDYTKSSSQRIYRSITVVAWFTANGHVTLLAVVRYVILVYPLKARVYLSTRRVLVLSGLVWALALVISVSPAILGFFIEITRRKSQEFQLAIWTTVYLTPVTTTVVLHLAKIFKIRQTTTMSTNEQANLRVQAMSRMVLLVIFIATVLPLPHVLHRFLQSFEGTIYVSSTISLHVGYISRILVLLNHSVNPVMYAFVSSPFRMSLKRMLGLDRNTSNVQSSRNAVALSTISNTERRANMLEMMTD